MYTSKSLLHAVFFLLKFRAEFGENNIHKPIKIASPPWPSVLPIADSVVCIPHFFFSRLEIRIIIFIMNFDSTTLKFTLRFSDNVFSGLLPPACL